MSGSFKLYFGWLHLIDVEIYPDLAICSVNNGAEASSGENLPRNGNGNAPFIKRFVLPSIERKQVFYKPVVGWFLVEKCKVTTSFGVSFQSELSETRIA